MLRVSLVLTVIGDDRPGLVGSLSEVVDAHEGSWQESHMAHLAGKFAGILRAEVPAARAADLQVALRALASDGLQVVVESSDAPCAAAAVCLQIELVGSDRPGLVRELSAAITDRGINIDEIRTGTTEAPMSGGRLFTATLKVRLPPETSIDHLRSALEGLANEIMVDIALDEVRE